MFKTQSYRNTITCSILLIVFMCIDASETKKVRIKTKDDLIAHPKAIVKSLDKFIASKMDVLDQLEKVVASFHSKSVEALKDLSLYVQHPLNCLKILTALVFETEVVIAPLLDQMGARYKYEKLLTDIGEVDLDRAVAVLTQHVTERGMGWDQFLIGHDKFDNEDKMQLLKALDRTDAITTSQRHQLASRIFQ